MMFLTPKLKAGYAGALILHTIMLSGINPSTR